VTNTPLEQAPEGAAAAVLETASAGEVPSEPTPLPAAAAADTDLADPTMATGKPARRRKTIAA
jgi:hypothetical protein